MFKVNPHVCVLEFKDLQHLSINDPIIHSHNYWRSRRCMDGSFGHLFAYTNPTVWNIIISSPQLIGGFQVETKMLYET